MSRGPNDRAIGDLAQNGLDPLQSRPLRVEAGS